MAPHRIFAQLVLCLCLVFSLTGCNETLDQQSPTPETPLFEIRDNPNEQTLMTQMSPPDQLAWAVGDLAGRLDVDSANVQLAGVRFVQWRSGAIGCPQAGMAYTQALVDGLLITLGVGDSVYRYHAKTGGQPFYCPAERAETPVKGSGAD